MASGCVVPYTLEELPNGNTKAYFAVPNDIASQLVAYPVLVGGGSFEITLSEDRGGAGGVACEYYSPTPSETADAIAARLRSRIEDPSLPIASESCIQS